MKKKISWPPFQCLIIHQFNSPIQYDNSKQTIPTTRGRARLGDFPFILSNIQDRYLILK